MMEKNLILTHVHPESLVPIKGTQDVIETLITYGAETQGDVILEKQALSIPKHWRLPGRMSLQTDREGYPISFRGRILPGDVISCIIPADETKGRVAVVERSCPPSTVLVFEELDEPRREKEWEPMSHIQFILLNPTSAARAVMSGHQLDVVRHWADLGDVVRINVPYRWVSEAESASAKRLFRRELNKGDALLFVIPYDAGLTPKNLSAAFVNRIDVQTDAIFEADCPAIGEDLPDAKPAMLETQLAMHLSRMICEAEKRRSAYYAEWKSLASAVRTADESYYRSSDLIEAINVCDITIRDACEQLWKMKENAL